MTSGTDVTAPPPAVDAFADVDAVRSIAHDLFVSMVDGEPGHLRAWEGDRPPSGDPVFAWVDVRGSAPVRVLLTTERETATHLTRALLAMAPDAQVGDEDFRDALGEVANVVGGNVKALVPGTSALSLPGVGHARPRLPSGALVHEEALDWRGHLVLIEIRSIP